MRIKFNDRCFPPENIAKERITQNLLSNLNKEFPIFNQLLKIMNEEKDKFEIRFSTMDFEKGERTDVYIRLHGLRTMEILIVTPYSFGLHFFKRRRFKKIFLCVLNTTLGYH